MRHRTFEAAGPHARLLRRRFGPAPRVLIVDDEPAVLKFVAFALTDAGYVTTTAGGGSEALEIWKKQGPFDLLLTDLMMPQMSGDELARQVRQLEPDANVLYLTGYADRLFEVKTRLWDHETYLDKPSSANGILEAVAMALFGHIRPLSDRRQASLLRRLRSLVRSTDKAADRGSGRGGSGASGA